MNDKKWLLKFSINKMFKKSIGFLAFILVSFSLFCLPVMAEQDSEETFATETGGDLYKEYPVKVYKNPEGIQTYADLPDSVNLSTSKYFPPIREQQGGSCSAWSKVYYQFTYEVAKINDWDVKKDNSKIFSPKYVWNYLNNGENNGLYPDDCYKFLERQGSLRWNEFPQDDLSFDWYEGANETTTVNALRQALKTRISFYDHYNFADPNNDSTPITENKDSDLSHMKQLLNEGHVLSISTDYNVSTVKNNKVLSDGTHKGEHVIIAGETASGGHALTIVGYDDTIYYDLNQNGKDEDFEYGAFLIANSWGTEAWGHNNGYIWVMYDALNQESNASNLNTTDRLLFIRSNIYWYIEVSNYTPQRMVEVTLQQKYRNDITVTLATSDDLTSSKTRQTTFLNGIGGQKSFDAKNDSYQTRTFVFDYADLYEADNKVYWVEITDNKAGNGANTTVQKIRWVDENGNILKTINQQPSLDGQTGSYCYGDDYSGTYEQAYGVSLHTKTSGIIDRRGDIDFFKFTPSASGVYLIYTTGSTDTRGYLYDSSQTLLVENDDALLSGNNFAFKYNLEANKTYYIKITGYSNSTTGSYTLNISKDFYGASIPSYNQDARRVQMQTEAATALTSLTLKIGSNTYTLNRPTSGDLDITINGARFKVTFEETNNGLSTIWIINAKIPATKSGTTDTVSFDFSKGKITDVKSPDLTGLVAYESAIKTGVDEKAVNSLQKLLDTMRQTGYTLEVYNWDNSLVNVTSTTKAVSGMKIVEKDASGQIRKVYYVVVFGDLTGGGIVNIGDGSITSVDALEILKKVAEISQLGALAEIAADVDHDGSVTSADALLINQYVTMIAEIDQDYIITAVPDDCYFGTTPVSF